MFSRKFNKQSRFQSLSPLESKLYVGYSIISHITLLKHLVCFVVLMRLRVVCSLCGAISFFSPKKLLLKRLNFRIHGVLEFREQSTHIFIATLKIYVHVYISMCPAFLSLDIVYVHSLVVLRSYQNF